MNFKVKYKWNGKVLEQNIKAKNEFNAMFLFMVDFSSKTTEQERLNNGFMLI